MKVVTVLGARPQFIKAATVSRAFKEAKVGELIVHTGQHFDKNMSEVFFHEMEIPKPDYQLEISGLSHSAMTGRMMEEVEKVLVKEKPKMVLVYGDTNSTLAGALAAAKLQIPVAHVEAGLRSFEMSMPEEINRILTDRISKFLFCPTSASVENLKNEGFTNFPCEIIQSGDVMLDAVLYYKRKTDKNSSIIRSMNLSHVPFALTTLHRAENTDNLERLQSICQALNEIHEEVKIVLPLHPRTRAIIQKNSIQTKFQIIDPVGYFDMLALLNKCQLVLTDSGGLQKEAYFFSKYCITLRDQTEWVELVDAGVNSLAGSNRDNIIKAFQHGRKTTIKSNSQLYGDGRAAEKIAAKIASF